MGRVASRRLQSPQRLDLRERLCSTVKLIRNSVKIGSGSLVAEDCIIDERSQCSFRQLETIGARRIFGIHVQQQFVQLHGGVIALPHPQEHPGSIGDNRAVQGPQRFVYFPHIVARDSFGIGRCRPVRYRQLDKGVHFLGRNGICIPYIDGITQFDIA